MAFLEYRPTETLYQFCSVEAFRGIAASKELWCSDLAAANDPREMVLGYEHFLSAMKFVRENEYKGPLGIFLAAIQKRVAEYRDSQQTFCTCFSPVKDDLPMWREYGGNYTGLAIGFRPTAIASMPGRIQKVKYLNPNTAEDFRQHVRDIAAKFDPQRSQNDFLYRLEAGVSSFTAITALKHHSWAYEKEIRFIHAQLRKPQREMPQIAEFSDETAVLWSKPLSRPGQNGFVDYKAFPFGRRKDRTSDSTRAIHRIVIGPRCSLTETEIRTLLEKNGYAGFKIEKSDCQIR
jgi:Protein of unknown function (DUF2971)